MTNLEEAIKSFQSIDNTDFVVVTTNDNEGKSAQDYADDFYDYNNFGLNDTNDGILFLIDMEDRNFHITTTGHTIAVLNDQRIDDIVQTITPDMIDGNYYDAAMNVIDLSDFYLTQGEDTGYTYDEATGKVVRQRSLSFTKWIVAIIIASISGTSFYIFTHRKYSLKKSEYSYPFHQMSKLNLTENTTHKTYDVVTQRHIPKPPSSGGGSSTHSGSSGTSHGGGGGSF